MSILSNGYHSVCPCVCYFARPVGPLIRQTPEPRKGLLESPNDCQLHWRGKMWNSIITQGKASCNVENVLYFPWYSRLSRLINILITYKETLWLSGRCLHFLFCPLEYLVGFSYQVKNSDSQPWEKPKHSLFLPETCAVKLLKLLLHVLSGTTAQSGLWGRRGQTLNCPWGSCGPHGVGSSTAAGGGVRLDSLSGPYFEASRQSTPGNVTAPGWTYSGGGR